MKRLFALVLTVLLLTTPLISCRTVPSGPNDPDAGNGGNGGDDTVISTLPEWMSGTDAIRLMLASDRLESGVLRDSENIFSTGTQALENLAATAKRNLAEVSFNGPEPLSALTPLATKEMGADGSYVEIDGNRYVWKNFAEHSNSYSYFLNLTTAVVTSAESGAKLIDDIKKNVRVVDKWVTMEIGAYYLHVEKDMELLLFRDSRPDAQNEACRRYRNKEGKNVYEIYVTNYVGSSRMIYIPGEKCEYSFQPSDGGNHDFLATNTKGYWEVVDIGRSENFYNVSCMVLKDDICYDAFYLPDFDSQYVDLLKIMSADKKTDILWISDAPYSISRAVTVHLQAFDGIASIESVGNIHADTWEGMTAYSSDVNAVLMTNNGSRIKKNDTFLDGRITVHGVYVRHTWQENGPIYVPSLDIEVNQAGDFDETFAILQEFFSLIGITCRRNIDEVRSGAHRAMQELSQFTKYHQWNESPIVSNTTLAEGFRNREAKFKAWEQEFAAIANAPTVDGTNEKELTLNMHFADVTAAGTVTVDGLTVTVSELTLTVTDTMLFVKNEPYEIAFALLDAAGNLHHIYVDNMPDTPFTADNGFSVTGSAAFTLPILDFGTYTLVACISTADGVRSSGYIPLPLASVTAYESRVGHTTVKTEKATNGALLLTFTEILDVEVTVDTPSTGHSYASLYDALAEHAYSFGFAEEGAMVEKQTEDGSWVALFGTEEALESGVYRLRYSIRNGDTIKSGTVFVAYDAPV